MYQQINNLAVAYIYTDPSGQIELNVEYLIGTDTGFVRN